MLPQGKIKHTNKNKQYFSVYSNAAVIHAASRRLKRADAAWRKLHDSRTVGIIFTLKGDFGRLSGCVSSAQPQASFHNGRTILKNAFFSPDPLAEVSQSLFPQTSQAQAVNGDKLHGSGFFSSLSH